MVSAREPLSVTPWYDSCFTFLFFLTFYGACVTLFLVGIMSDSTDYPTIFIAVLTTLFLWYFVASKRLASAVLWRIRCAYCFFLDIFFWIEYNIIGNCITTRFGRIDSGSVQLSEWQGFLFYFRFAASDWYWPAAFCVAEWYKSQTTLVVWAIAAHFLLMVAWFFYIFT